MNDLHEITGWLRAQDPPSPGQAPDQPPGFYDLDARNGPLTTFREEACYVTRQPGHARARPG